MKYLILFFAFINTTFYGQTITGQWETFDDKTKEKKALIEIYKTNNIYYAKIIKTFVGDSSAVCKKCKGARKNQPIIGLVIIEKLKKNGKKFDGGEILDPESGNIYKCYLQLVNKNKLKVRGFMGISIFGRTQYWLRKKK